MAAGLRMSTSVVVTLALHEDLFLGVLGLIVFLADLELWDLDFLVGIVKDVNLASISDEIFISSRLGTVSGTRMASVVTVTPYLFTSCCRRDRPDLLMKGLAFLLSLNSFAVSETQLGIKHHTPLTLRKKNSQQRVIITII